MTKIDSIAFFRCRHILLAKSYQVVNSPRCIRLGVPHLHVHLSICIIEDTILLLVHMSCT